MIGVASVPARVLAPGDPRRRPLGRAVGLSFAAAVLFVVSCVAVKDVKTFSAAAPWSEDPYDAFVSFAMFFVAGILAVNGVRTWLCRRAEPLPTSRVEGIVRGFRVITIVSLTTLGAAWVSVLLRPAGSPASSLVYGLIAGLALNTALTVAGLVTLAVADRRLERRSSDDVTDFLGDLVVAARRAATVLPGEGGRVARLVDAIDARLVPAVRRRRTGAAVSLAAGFGLIVGVGALVEGDPPVLAGLMATIGTGGMLAFLVVVGSYLRLVRPEGPPVHRPTFLVPAVAAAMSLPVAVAFRDGLWWIVGSTADTAGITDLARLLAILAATTFGVAAVAITVRRRLAARGDT